ncbi:MAG TPA: hypothetical protein VFL14_12300 [Xanthomonadales bacterium]|nr:hypothetical protein [Xanthomonadales bacterium]
MPALRALLSGGVLGAAMLLASGAATAAEKAKETDTSGPPSATLDLASEQMRLIMGGTAGKGTLHYKGADHRFTFKTASAGIGAKAVKEVDATGRVYGLKQLADFAGKYTSVTHTALAGSAEVSATYENDKGVVLKLTGTVKGVGLGLGGGMATIELVED